MTEFYKFLLPDRLCPYACYMWPEPGVWTPRIDGDLVADQSGYHVSRLKDLPIWIGPVLWRVEVSEAVDLERESLARQARLTERVTSWDLRDTQQIATIYFARRVRHIAASKKVDTALSTMQEHESRKLCLDALNDVRRGEQRAAIRAIERIWAHDADWSLTAHPARDSAALAAVAAARHARRVCQVPENRQLAYEMAKTAEETFQAEVMGGLLGLLPMDAGLIEEITA